MSAVHTPDRRLHATPQTRPHAHRLAHALQRRSAAEPALPVDDEAAEVPPWLTVYADEQEAGGADEVLMEAAVAQQTLGGARGLGW